MARNTSLSIDIDVTFNESLARRRVGDRMYAGVPVVGYLEQVVVVAQGVTQPLGTPPGGNGYAMVIISTDTGTSIAYGWTLSGVTYEVPINELLMLKPPVGSTGHYVRNAGTVGTTLVPVKLIMAY